MFRPHQTRLTQFCEGSAETDVALACMGYDNARRCGVLAPYKRMLNRAGNANYSRADIQQAAERDAMKGVDGWFHVVRVANRNVDWEKYKALDR